MSACHFVQPPRREDKRLSAGPGERLSLHGASLSIGGRVDALSAREHRKRCQRRLNGGPFLGNAPTDGADAARE